MACRAALPAATAAALAAAAPLPVQYPAAAASAGPAAPSPSPTAQYAAALYGLNLRPPIQSASAEPPAPAAHNASGIRIFPVGSENWVGLLTTYPYRFTSPALSRSGSSMMNRCNRGS